MINKKDNENLSPCPSCGSEAKYFQILKLGTQADMVGVICTECEMNVFRCNFAGFKVKARQEIVTKIWNKRT